MDSYPRAINNNDKINNSVAINGNENQVIELKIDLQEGSGRSMKYLLRKVHLHVTRFLKCSHIYIFQAFAKSSATEILLK